MSVLAIGSGLSYEARARIADNLLVARRRAGLSQVALGEIAIVSFCRISEIENGRVVGMLDTYVRMAGALGATLDDLLGGVRWTPGTIESEYEAVYTVKGDFETRDGRPPDEPNGLGPETSV